MNARDKGIAGFIIIALLTVVASWRASLHTHALAAGVQHAEEYSEPGWLPPLDSHRWKCIVIHHSATEVGGAARFDRAHRDKGWDELGYHFVIGNGSDTADGQVEVGPRWTAQKHGAHCYTPDEFYNTSGIGICLVGNLDHRPPTPAQEQSIERLVRFLCRRYDIPPAQIYTHGQVTGRTRCPGAMFDLNEVRRAVSGNERAAINE